MRAPLLMMFVLWLLERVLALSSCRYCSEHAIHACDKCGRGVCSAHMLVRRADVGYAGVCHECEGGAR